MTTRAIAIPAFAALAALAFYQEAQSQSNFVEKLAPDVWVRKQDPSKNIIANAGRVVFRDYVLAIDANYPWGAKAIVADIRKTTSKPIKFAFDTHYHADHAFGNSVFVDAGATIVCSRECTEESLAKNPKAWEGNTATGDYSLKPYRLEHPQVAFDGKMVFDDGQHRVELIRVGPGHTRGDAVAWLPKERILFTGDLCTTSAGNNMADVDANHDSWLRALDNLLTFDVVKLVPGHGPLSGADGIQRQRAYLASIIEGVRTGLGKGTPVEKLMTEIDLSAHKPKADNADGNGRNIKAVYLKLSQR